MMARLPLLRESLRGARNPAPGVVAVAGSPELSRRGPAAGPPSPNRRLSVLGADAAASAAAAAVGTVRRASRDLFATDFAGLRRNSRDHVDPILAGVRRGS